MVQVTAAGFQAMANRHDDLQRFYAILDRLEKTLEGARRLADCSGRMSWPRRGIYFFREERDPLRQRASPAYRACRYRPAPLRDKSRANDDG
jgi:hypothetical protein